MLDLSKIAGMDLEKLPGVEQSGERCIRNIQEWLLHEVSSDEAAVLPRRQTTTDYGWGVYQLLV